jgi:hypothetical protein
MNRKEPPIPEKPTTVIGKIEGDSIIPSCIMCERELNNEEHLTGVWVSEEHKRNYIYSVCDTCFRKYKTEDIEEKIILTLATRTRFKASKQ